MSGKEVAPRQAGWNEGIALRRELVRLGKEFERLNRKGVRSANRLDPLAARLNEVRAAVSKLGEKINTRA